MNNKRTLINSLMSLILQFVTIVSGFIIPRLILGTFGSEVNGLVSSLTQFLNYINLFEGGLGAVILASLYKPLNKKDFDKVSSILVASIQFYRKLAILFLGYTVILAVLYPLFTKTGFSFEYVSTLVLILSINMFVQYCFSITFRNLLKADQKVYFVSSVQILVIIINTIGIAVMIKLIPNLHVVKLTTAIIYLLQPILFNYYVNRNYKLDLTVQPDQTALKQRWNGFGINLAAFIHNNTDMVILTIFTSLKTVSIYSVYYLVTSGLKSLITSISAGIVPTIGHLYASEDKDKLMTAFDNYEFIIFFFTFLLFTVGAILITPFAMLYTMGITDTNYNQPLFGIFMILAETTFCLREPYVNMAYSAGKFSEISGYAYIEAILNIILSVVLVNKFGLIGVAFSTFISMVFRTIAHVIFLKNEILRRSILIFIKKLIVFSFGAVIIVISSSVLFTYNDHSVFGWIVYAIKNTLLASVIYGLISFCFYKKEVTGMMAILKRKK